MKKGFKHSIESINKMQVSKLGINNPMFGKYFSDEHRRHLSEARIGHRDGMLGKHHSEKSKQQISKNSAKFNLGKHLSEETKQKMRIAHLGKSSGMKGKHHSKETKRKMTIALLGKNTGKFHSENTKLRISNSHKGKHHSIKTKGKISKAHRGKKFTLERKQKMGKSHIGKKLSKEHILKMHNSMLGKNIGKHHSDETKLKLRLHRINTILKTGIFPMSLGQNETKILNELENRLNYKIIRNHPVIGYFLDGYCQELNLAIEVDEPYHFDINGNLREKDIIRQQNIEQALNCKFLRIKESDYLKENKIPIYEVNNY